MKAILEFNLPEDEDNFRMATHASDYFAALWDFAQWLRENLKYRNDEVHKMNGYEFLEKCNEEFYYILNERKITIDEN